MNLWMLDTNTVSNAVRKRSALLDAKLAGIASASLCVSAVTYGESRFGLAQRPEAHLIATAMHDFYAELTILPWTTETSIVYGDLRATMKRTGKSLSPLDMLIAAHSLETGAMLVTSDRAFRFVPGLTLEDWTAP